MRKAITAAVLGLLCVGGAANARGDDASGIIQGRQAAMMLSGVAMGSIKASIDAQQPPSSQRFNSRALARWAHAVPGMFPAGSDTGAPTHARAEVWSDRAGFEARAADYAAAADRLAELAAGEDAAAFSAQWTVVRQSCNACHTAYKAD